MSRPTMEDVAAQAGVSRALVSLVMRNAPHVSEHRRKAVLDAAHELGYRPNVLARNLASDHSHTIGVVINDLHNPFFAETVDGLQAGASDAGYRLIIGNGCQTQSGESLAVETFVDYRVDAMILIGPHLPTNQIVALAASMPVIAIGRSLRSRAVGTVNSDESLGAQLAIGHLINCGHRDIAHIDGGVGAGGAPRRAGYERAMKAAGLAEMIRVVKGDFNESSGAYGAEQLLGSGRRPTAIFAANDQSAIGALGVIESRGLSVPADVSIVGYDNIWASATRRLSLTTIDQPRAEMGRVANQLAMDRIEGRTAQGVHYIVQPTLVERSTTAPPHPRSKEI